MRDSPFPQDIFRNFLNLTFFSENYTSKIKLTSPVGKICTYQVAFWGHRMKKSPRHHHFDSHPPRWRKIHLFDDLPIRQSIRWGGGFMIEFPEQRRREINMFQNDLQYAISENFSIWRLVCLESRIRENSFLAEKRGGFFGAVLFLRSKSRLLGGWLCGFGA